MHFAPKPLVQYTTQFAEIYCGLLLILVGGLGALMVSNLRYTSFKSVGTRRRSTRIMILMVGAGGMLVWLYSRYVLLGLVSVYVLHGVVGRISSFFRRRSDKELK